MSAAGRPNSVMIKKNDPRRQTTTLLDSIESVPTPRRKNLRDGDDRPLSVLLNPGAQMMNLHQQQQQQQNSPTIQSLQKSSPPSSVVSAPAARESAKSRTQSANAVNSAGAAALTGAEKRSTSNLSRGSRDSRDSAASSSTATKTSNNNAPAPQSMQEAMSQFAQAKSQAQRQVRHNMSATARLINALADVTVCLLTRAMNEGMLEKVELRIYKKPIHMGGGNFAVAEYRNVSVNREKSGAVVGGSKDKAKDADKGGAESEFIILSSGELLTGDAGKDRDNVENWTKFFDLVKSWMLWWRYCMAVHKRIGWGLKLERSMLNVVDSRVLGFVTIKFSNFV